MAKSNWDRVGEVMEALREGLAPYVVRAFREEFKEKALKGIEVTLRSEAYTPPSLPDDASAIRILDVQNCLKLINYRDSWENVFAKRLSKTDRSYVNELSEARNRWAHQQSFASDDAYRVADTAGRLLDAVGAPREADRVRDIANDLLRLRYDAQQNKAKKPTGPLSDTPSTTLPGLKPWRLVVKPHPDVASGTYIMAEFAADLAQVVRGKASAEYGEPKEFFRRTFLTDGLVALLANGAKRLNGKGGDPVVQVQTNFGGGKTHSLLALYHLFGGTIGISEIPGGEKLVERVEDLEDKTTARIAVIVGTAFAPTETRQHRDATTRTLWGEIAYQLGGVDAYRMVEQADLTGTSPGSDVLVDLLNAHGPALIIMDELVAYARNMYGAVERLPGGTFGAVMTFIQALTEAVKRSSDAFLVVSIPVSDNEIGGEGGRAALEGLSKTIGRVETVWRPVTPTEGFEIVRRRLFSSEVDYPARDAVLSAFREMYAANKGEFPPEIIQQDYADRMRSTYPIHPELFDRLYGDWSTLDRFQRTRGVLQLMAEVIHQLWLSTDQSLLIMPGSIPIYAPSVRNRILTYLPETWPAIIDADVDGEDSRPFAIDRAVPTLGQNAVCRRVGRAVFMGSAPSVTAQGVRGLEEVRIRLATVQPGEQLSTFGDALRRMSNQLTYLYTDGLHYWYDTRPTVNRLALDRAQIVSADTIYGEQVARLRAIRPNRDYFGGVHVAPQTSADIADEARARLVVLDPEYAHRKNDENSKAMVAIKDILVNRGGAPRLYRNMLIFATADATDAEALEKAIREFIAWKSIEDEAEPLNLDAQQIRQVRTNRQRADETVQSRLQEAYGWLIVPSQPDRNGPVELQALRISGQESLYERAIRKLRQSELLIPRWSPDSLELCLNELLWRDRPHVGLKQLWEYLAQYIYLPRLVDQNVLTDAIKEGVARADAPFAYATKIGLNGVYNGLVFRHDVNTLYFNDDDVLVRPEVAQAQLDAAQPATPVQLTVIGTGAGVTVAGGTNRIVEPPKPRLTTRYHGTVDINPQRVNKEIGAIVEEIIERLTGQSGTNVRITLEIEADRSTGFDDNTIQTISENSRTLRFRDQGFEKE